MNKPGRASSEVVPSSLKFEIAEQQAVAATGTADHSLALRLITDVHQALWQPAHSTEEERILDLRAAVASLEAINPRDGIEGMLAVQIVATHNAALECLRRAMQSQQSFELRASNLKHAERLMSLYLRQLEAMDRRRGQGQQNVTVKQVNVEAGGQAVVGVVNANPGRRKLRAPSHELGQCHEVGKPKATPAASE